MIRRLIFLVIAICAACEQTSQRTIPYRSDRPIEERLQPGDTKVLVEMKLPPAPPGAPAATESFEQEIERLKRNEVIAVVRVSAAQGEIADRGTWVRTKVTGAIERAVRPTNTSTGESIEFSFPGGDARINSVDISTGKYPKFLAGEQYLVFLEKRPGTVSSLIWSGTAFRINAAGALQRVAISDGSEQSFPTNLYGRNISEVAGALAR